MHFFNIFPAIRQGTNLRWDDAAVWFLGSKIQRGRFQIYMYIAICDVISYVICDKYLDNFIKSQG